MIALTSAALTLKNDASKYPFLARFCKVIDRFNKDWPARAGLDLLRINNVELSKANNGWIARSEKQIIDIENIYSAMAAFEKKIDQLDEDRLERMQRDLDDIQHGNRAAVAMLADKLRVNIDMSCVKYLQDSAATTSGWFVDISGQLIARAVILDASKIGDNDCMRYRLRRFISATDEKEITLNHAPVISGDSSQPHIVVMTIWHTLCALECFRRAGLPLPTIALVNDSWLSARKGDRAWGNHLHLQYGGHSCTQLMGATPDEVLKNWSVRAAEFKAAASAFLGIESTGGGSGSKGGGPSLGL